MAYNIEQLKTMDAACIAGCSQKHVQSVVEELIETALRYQQDARRYAYVVECDVATTMRYIGGDAEGMREKVRAKHDAEVAATTKEA